MTLREVFLSKFSPRLLGKTAFVYRRQSSLKQVRENIGSTLHQKSLRGVVEEMGFSAENIVEIDSDTASTGARSEHRLGIQRILAGIRADDAGLVAVGDLSRAHRNAREQFELFEACKIFEVPLFYDGRLHDATDINELLTMQLTAVVNENTNLRRRSDMLNGRYAKARAGYAVSRVPRGFVNVDGKLELDPDPAVQEAIRRVIREFRRQRRLRTTFLALKRDGVKLPTRIRGRLSWVKPTRAGVEYILTNPIYAGRYHFRRYVADPRYGFYNGHVRCRPAEPHEMIPSPVSHEGYMSWEDFLQIQEILGSHAGKGRRSHSADGPAICQGLLRCPEHSERLLTPKPRSASAGPNDWHYYCPGDQPEGGRQCVDVALPYVDGPVMAAVLRRIEKPRLEIVREAYHRARKEEGSEKYRLQTDLDRARARERKLGHLYTTEDESNAVVRRKLSAKWEEAITEVERLEKKLESVSSARTVFDGDKAFQRLAELCEDPEAILLHPATRSIDRKEVVRCLVDKVILEICTPKVVQLRIVWSSGEPDEVIEVLRWGYALERIEAADAEERSNEDVLQELNDLGVLNRKLLPYKLSTVAHARWAFRQQRRRQGRGREVGSREERS